jgi:hypothetical protein
MTILVEVGKLKSGKNNEMSEVNKDIIKSFLTKMATQDNRSTASLFYYVIRTEVEVRDIPEYCEESRYHDPEDCEESYKSPEECRLKLKEHEFFDDEIEKIVNRLEETGVRKEWKHKGMFLTETDAENHLKSNSYHYSDNAHTYVHHAWRAPELQTFFKALFQEYKVSVKGFD